MQPIEKAQRSFAVIMVTVGTNFIPYIGGEEGAGVGLCYWGHNPNPLSSTYIAVPGVHAVYPVVGSSHRGLLKVMKSHLKCFSKGPLHIGKCF